MEDMDEKLVNILDNSVIPHEIFSILLFQYFPTVFYAK